MLEFPVLTDKNTFIYLVNCQLREDSLIAGFSRFSPNTEAGDYELFDDWHQIVCSIEIPDCLNQPESVLLTQEVEYKVKARNV